MICWLNGAFCPVEQARIDPQDRGFLLGDGIFETMLAVDGVVRRAPRHLARLAGAAELLGFLAPFSDNEILAAIGRLLQENGLHQGRAVLRLTLTRGAGARGLAPPPHVTPALLLTAAATSPPPQSMRAIISSCVRNEKSVTSRIKSLNYLDNIMARREAVQNGADEALMRNSTGDIAAASAANIFVVEDGVLSTPSVGDGALPGVMRSIVLAAAAELDIPAREGPVAIEALTRISEAFLSNALIGVCPLVEIDGKVIGNGVAGPITRQLQLISKDRE